MMVHLNDSMGFRALLLHLTILHLLLSKTAGQHQLVCPSQPIVATVGDDITFPCHLRPAKDVSDMTVEWARPELNPRFVHVWRDGVELESKKHPSYRGRTSVSIDKLKLGDISLTLSRVMLSDAGQYKCLIPGLGQALIQLVVGAVSPPFIVSINITSSGVVLQCECAGWYPEPEVLWLDGEGKLLSAGPTETVRGPDDLYTVSSRVTVEKRHSNSFTCRVQQRNINQTRQTAIQVSADCLEAPSCSAARVGILVFILLIFIFAAAYVVWKWRQHKTKETKMKRDAERAKTETEQLVAEGKKMEDLEEKKAKFAEMLQKNEEEEKDLEQVVKTLMEQEEQLKEQIDQMKDQKNAMETNITDIENKLQSVEKMAESDRYHEMKSIVLTAKNQLKGRKQEDEKLLVETQGLLSKTQSLINRMTDRKKEAENYKETLSEQLEETEKQQEEIQKKLQSEQT